jgi:peptidoglycan/LPS O-acetylase OafA/YrhL
MGCVDSLAVNGKTTPAEEGGSFLSLFRRVTTSGSFIPEIDGLRFVAIFAVVVFHLAAGLAIKAPAAYALPQSGLAAQLAWHGFRGVELFFVISGFILALPFASHFLEGRPRVALSQYFLRRVTRLEPPYLLAMMLLFVLHTVVRGRSAAELWPHLCASLVYLHNLVYGTESPINNISWSLEIEIQFYLLVPLLSLLFAIRQKLVRRAVIVAICVVSTVLGWLFIAPGDRAYLSILRFTHFFLVGFLLADVYLMDWKRERSRVGGGIRRSWAWDCVSIICWPLLFFFWSAGSKARDPMLVTLLAPWVVLALYCAAFRGRITNAFFTTGAVTVIGGMCYSIYLLHNPALALILDVTRFLPALPWYGANLLLQTAIAGPLLLIPCGAYFLLIEKPCMRRDWPRRLWLRFRPLKPSVTAD